MKQRVTVQITSQDSDRPNTPISCDELPAEWGAELLGWGAFDIDLDLPDGWTHFSIMFGDTIVMGEMP